MECLSAAPISTASPIEESAPSRQPSFLRLLPAIQRDAQIAFRCLNPDAREETVQDVVANAFVAYARLVELGQVDRAFAAPLARFMPLCAEP